MTSDPAPTTLELVLYSKPGCHLCDDARQVLDGLLRARRAAGLPSPALVERNILDDPDWERAYFETIPVLEIAGRQLPLAIRPVQMRAFVDETLAAAAPAAPATPAAPAVPADPATTR